MNAAVNTYHYFGPLSARQSLGARPNPAGKATVGSNSGLTLRHNYLREQCALAA
jgi:hypothetical protein